MIKSLLAGLLVLTMLFAAIPSVKADKVSEAKEKLEALQEEKDVIDEQIAQLQSQLSDNLDQMEDIVQQKNLIDQEIFLLYTQVANISDQITSYATLIADKQEQLDQAQAYLAELQEQNKERVRAMEKNGKVSYWSVLFNANSFADLLDRLHMIAEIAEADRQRLEQTRQAAEAVEQAKEVLEAEKSELAQVQANLQTTQAALELKRHEADALLSQLIAKGQEFEDLLEESEAKQEELADKLAKAEDEYEDAKYQEELRKQQEAGGIGGVGNTVNGVTWLVPMNYTRFSSPFGYRIHPLSGQWKMHNGVDLAAPTGTEIYATRSGYVSFTGYQKDGAGNYVQINHGDGYKSIYMHMTYYTVSVGQYVKAGQVIGYCGDTGGSTGPHLHFGISYNGTYVNPADYISI